jgi:hypothetical protein
MNNPQIPEAYYSGVLGLGMAKAYFPVRGINRVGSLIFFFLFLIASMGVFFFGLYDAYLAYQAHGPAMLDDRLATPTIVALVLFGIGLLAGWGAYANWNKGAAVFEHGLACRDRKGFKSWRWDDINSLTAAVTRHYTNGIYTGTTHVYTLFNRQNERLVLNDAYAKVEDLARTIEGNIYPRLYQQAAGLYNAGQALVFGPVAISRAGIQIGKKTYPWEEVKQVSIQQGYLKVAQKNGGWFSGASAMASAIPNLGVLLSIIDQTVGLKAG